MILATECYKSSGNSNDASPDDDSNGNNNIVVRARGSNGDENISILVNNQQVASWTLSTSMQNYTASNDLSGGVAVNFTNDANGRDVQVDYVQVNGPPVCMPTVNAEAVLIANGYTPTAQSTSVISDL
jgi:hypothetical protein